MNDFSRSHHRNERDAAPNPKGNERKSERSEARDERENERTMSGDGALAMKLKDGVQDLEKELNEANSKVNRAKKTVAVVETKLKNYVMLEANLRAIEINLREKYGMSTVFVWYSNSRCTIYSRLHGILGCCIVLSTVV